TGGGTGLGGDMPGHRQVLALPELFQAGGEEVLDPPQVFLVGGLGADRQSAGKGAHGQRCLHLISPKAPFQPVPPALMPRGIPPACNTTPAPWSNRSPAGRGRVVARPASGS